eukprot:scaffold320628_cov19-Tisochrysis_lutea.AAC.2
MGNDTEEQRTTPSHWRQSARQRGADSATAGRRCMCRHCASIIQVLCKDRAMVVCIPKLMGALGHCSQTRKLRTSLHASQVQLCKQHFAAV